jgi:3',5'-cyclic AMP phosphodiesterase CpdA
MMRVFAVEPTAVQLDWPALPPGPHEVAAGNRAVTVTADGGPGAVVLDGLAPATRVDVTLDGRRVTTVTTPAAPPGRLLARVATIGDLHLGETRFGVLPTLSSRRDPAVAHPVVCTAAAVDELLAWGADFLVVKGDLAHGNHRSEYELAGELLGQLPVPTMLLPGNHDGGNIRGRDAAALLAAQGLRMVEDVTVADVPGLRIIGVDTRTPTQAGTVSAATEAVSAAAAGAPGGALVVLHHQLMTAPVATYPPPGVPAREARRFLDALAAAQPRTIVTSGHTHRHRARTHGPLLVTEVGSPKDYPGTWAGYLVYEGGVVQTVRRVMAPEAIRWTQRTARMFGGAWGRWSPGRLSDRCVSRTWMNP